MADRAGMRKQSMSELVDYLEERGYVERVADPDDRRARIVRLTAKGWAAVDTAKGIIARIEDEWAREIGQRRMQHIRAGLERLSS